MIQFWIDESIAHSWIPISNNHKNAITTNAPKIKTQFLPLEAKQDFDNAIHSSTLLCTSKMTLHQRLR